MTADRSGFYVIELMAITMGEQTRKYFGGQEGIWGWALSSHKEGEGMNDLFYYKVDM